MRQHAKLQLRLLTKLKCYQGQITSSDEDESIVKKFSEYDQFLHAQLQNSTDCLIADLTEEQRKKFFRRVLKNNPVALKHIEDIFERVSGLDDLSNRPAIARLLMTAIPSLRGSDIENIPNEISETMLFNLIINALLKRDENLFGEFLSNSERHNFLKELAFTLSRKGQDYFIDNRSVRAIVERLFEQKIRSHETPDIIVEQFFRTCRRAAGLTVEKTILGLSRNADDPETRIGFSHNALREYVFAEYIRDNLFRESAQSSFASTTLSERTVEFLHPMITESNEREQLLSRLNTFDKLRDFYFAIAWRMFPNIEREDLIAILGSPPNFSLLDLSNLDLSERDLSDALFTDSLIGGVSFRESTLDGAIFHNAVIEHVAFDSASLTDTDFATADIRSIFVYDQRQKRVVKKTGTEARQWLFTEGSDVDTSNGINVLSRSRKYQVAHRILQKMQRYNFVRTHNEAGLLRGLGDGEITGRHFLEALRQHDYLEFVRKAARGGRGADVVAINPSKRSNLQMLFNGQLPDDLSSFFDDLPSS